MIWSTMRNSSSTPSVMGSVTHLPIGGRICGASRLPARGAGEQHPGAFLTPCSQCGHGAVIGFPAEWGTAMCGISGEIRFDGRAAHVGAVAAMTDELAPAVPTAAGSGRRDRSPSVTAGSRSSTCRARAQPMTDSELGLTIVFNGCIYNHHQLRSELVGRGLPLLLHQRHRGDPQGVPPLG